MHVLNFSALQGLPVARTPLSVPSEVWTPYSWFSSLSNYAFKAKNWGAIVTDVSDVADYGTTNPRNPRQFDTLGGGRNSVSEICFFDKNIVPKTLLRGAQQLFHALFKLLASEHCLGHFGPR